MGCNRGLFCYRVKAKSCLLFPFKRQYMFLIGLYCSLQCNWFLVFCAPGLLRTKSLEKFQNSMAKCCLFLKLFLLTKYVHSKPVLRFIINPQVGLLWQLRIIMWIYIQMLECNSVPSTKFQITESTGFAQHFIRSSLVVVFISCSEYSTCVLYLMWKFTYMVVRRYE